MSKFLLNEEEIDNIRMMYESYGIILNEESIFGTIARKAVAWAGKNEDDIIKLFQTTEAALAKSIDDIVSASIKTRNLAQLDDLQAKLMHFYNPEYLEKIDWSKVSNAKNMDDYNKVIAKAIKTGDYSYVSRGGFEKFGISDFRDYLKNNISKVNEVIPEIGRWSVVFK
jgi:hypothetical protein